ncbi:MAG: Tad domain-containing protein [Candidatus Dormibacteria bacterium]
MRRARPHGQIVPLMALLMVVLTGFVALAIDTGVAYDQSRTDQDVSDAAALAATYWIWLNVHDQSPPNLSGAFAAAANVANLDCTGPSAPCSLTLSFYGSTWTSSNPGTALCQASVQNVANPTPVTWIPSSCTAALGSVWYAGASVASTAHTYIGAPAIGSKNFSVSNQAVAQVVGGTGGTGQGLLYLNCVLCILGGENAYYSSGATEGLTIESTSDLLDLTSDGANMDINQGFDCEGSSDVATIDTTTGGSTPDGSVNVAGTYTDNCGSSGKGLTWKPASTKSPYNPITGTKPISDALQSMQMPSLTSCPNNENYGNTYDTSPLGTPITTSTTLQPGCYDNVVINGKQTGLSQSSGGQDCVSNGDGIDVIFKPGTYVIYGGLTIEGQDPTVESDNSTARVNPGTDQNCHAGGVTLDFVCQTSNYNGSGVAGPATCDNSGVASTGAGLVMNTSKGSTTCNSQGLDTGDGNLPCDFQWNLFPPASGDWENLVIIFDRYNSGSIVTASQTPDPDSDHNGAIYAPSATYVMANYGSSGPVEGSGTSCITPLGAPVIVDYMQVYANYNQTSPACTEYVWADGSFSFDLDNDVELNGGGPGGLSG